MLAMDTAMAVTLPNAPEATATTVQASAVGLPLELVALSRDCPSVV
jgi:hypothetical protein